MRRALAQSRSRMSAARSGMQLVLRLLFLLMSLSPLSAGGESGSRPDSSWQEVLTGRTRIIFQAQDRLEAERLAGFADRVVDRLGQILEHQPVQRIPVVLRGRTDIANGYFAIAPARITLFLSPDQGYPGYFGPSEGWLELVFTHEAAHYIQLTRPDGLSGSLGKIFGDAASSLGIASLPAWFIEGSATYLESLLSSGGRGRSASFAMEILADIYDLHSWSYQEAGYDWAGLMSSRVYRSGALLVSYIADTWGFDALNRIQGALLSNPLGSSLEKEMARELGMGPEEIWARALRSFATRYIEQLQIPEGEEWHGLKNERELTRLSLPEGLGSGLVLSYFDKDSIAGLAYLGKTEDRNGTTPEPEILTPRSWNMFGFDAAGKSLVFSHRESRTQGRDRGRMATIAGVYRAELSEEGLGTPRLISPADGLDYHSPTIALGADTEIILALRRRGSIHDLVALGGSTFSYSSGLRLSSPQLSPDGRLVALSEHGPKGSRLIVLPLDGGPALEGEWLRAAVEFPRWNAEGTKLLLASDFEGTRQLYQIDIDQIDIDSSLSSGTGSDGSHPLEFRRVHADPVGIIAGELLEDGSILYVVPRSRSQVLMRAPANGGFLPAPDKQRVDWMPGLETEIEMDFSPGTEAPEARVSDLGFRFHSWLPGPLFRLDYGSDSLDFGVGIAAMAGDLVEESTLFLGAGLYLGSLQPLLGISWQQKLGQADLGIELSQNYQSRLNQYRVVEALQQTEAELSLNLPLYLSTKPGKNSMLMMGIGISADFLLEGRREFSIREGLDPGTHAPYASNLSQLQDGLFTSSRLASSLGFSFSSFEPAPFMAFYGSTGGWIQSQFLLYLEGLRLNSAAMGGVLDLGYAFASRGGRRISGSLQALAINNAGANSSLGYRAPFSPPPIAADLRMQTAFEFNLPLGFMDMSVGALVIDRIGISTITEWGGSFAIPGLRNPSLVDAALARSIWYHETGSTIGAPWESQKAASQTGASLEDYRSLLENAKIFNPDSFIVQTLTLDLGMGAASLRPLFQAGVSMKLSLDGTYNIEFLPVLFFDLSNLL